MTFRFAFTILNLSMKKYIINKWGKAFYSRYIKAAKEKLRAIEAELPKKVDPLFDFNYKAIAAYAPIYYALQQQNVDRNDIDMAIWRSAEAIYNLAPAFLIRERRLSRKKMMRYKAYQRKGEMGRLGKNDWVMNIEEEGGGTYYCRFIECGAYKILKNRGYDFVFPCVCRLDYLMANKRGIRLERDKTIADGDALCNNHIMGLGFTEWAPEKGFISRK